MKVFHKEKDLRPKIRELQAQLRREQRKLDRDIFAIQQKSKQCEVEVKKYAKTGHMEAAVILAKEIAGARKSISRLYQARAQINSVFMELDAQVALAKMASALKQSTVVMQSMSQLIKVGFLFASTYFYIGMISRLNLHSMCVENIVFF